MPRYLVERSFPAGQNRLADARPAPHTGADVIDAHARRGVTWFHSYVTVDRRLSWCICESPSPEAIRMAAHDSGLPVDRITEVQTLDPHVLR